MKRAIAAFLLALISMASITSVESSAASLIDKEIIVVNDVGSTEKTSFLTNSSGVLKCNDGRV